MDDADLEKMRRLLPLFKKWWHKPLDSVEEREVFKDFMTLIKKLANEEKQ